MRALLPSRLSAQDPLPRAPRPLPTEAPLRPADSGGHLRAPPLCPAVPDPAAVVCRGPVAVPASGHPPHRVLEDGRGHARPGSPSQTEAWERFRAESWGTAPRPWPRGVSCARLRAARRLCPRVLGRFGRWTVLRAPLCCPSAQLPRHPCVSQAVLGRQPSPAGPRSFPHSRPGAD